MLKFEINKEEKQYFTDGLKASEEIVKSANKHRDTSPICIGILEAKVFKKIASNIFWLSEREHVEPVSALNKNQKMKSKTEDPKEASYQKMIEAIKEPSEATITTIFKMEDLIQEYLSQDQK